MTNVDGKHEFFSSDFAAEQDCIYKQKHSNVIMYLGYTKFDLKYILFFLHDALKTFQVC